VAQINFPGGMRSALHPTRYLGDGSGHALWPLVKDQVGNSRKRIDLVDGGLKSSSHIWIRSLVKTDVAIADLHEAEPIALLCFVTVATSEGIFPTLVTSEPDFYSTETENVSPHHHNLFLLKSQFHVDSNARALILELMCNETGTVCNRHFASLQLSQKNETGPIDKRDRSQV
jgi:hypothetical protein